MNKGHQILLTELEKEGRLDKAKVGFLAVVWMGLLASVLFYFSFKRELNKQAVNHEFEMNSQVYRLNAGAANAK